MLLECIAKIESRLDAEAINRNKNGSIDIGLMQVNSYWIKTLGLDRQRLTTDACYNTMVGASILKQCIDRHGYTWEAIGCYNAVSMDKKTAYSWKIFRQLKAEGRQKAKLKSPMPTSSLYFRSWDRSTCNSSFGIPQHPAGETP